MPLSFATIGAAAYDEQPADLRASVDRAATAAQAQVGAARQAHRGELRAAARHKVTITTSDKIDPALHKMLAAAAATAIAAWKRDAGP